jgi:hypothetical protein
LAARGRFIFSRNLVRRCNNLDDSHRRLDAKESLRQRLGAFIELPQPGASRISLFQPRRNETSYKQCPPSIAKHAISGSQAGRETSSAKLREKRA